MELFSLKYTIPYLIFLGYLLLLMIWEIAKSSKGQSIKDIQWLTIIGFVFFFGLRGFVGTDWVNYYPFFNTAGEYFSWEPGFTLYTLLIKSIHPNYFFWIFVSSLTNAVLLHIIFKRYAKYYVLGFIVFLAFNGIIMEINLMRNIKSILIFLVSLKYLQERKILPYMLLNLLGVTFHISSILFLPLYFVLHREIPKLYLWIMFAGGMFVFFLQIAYIKPVMSFFAEIIGGRLPGLVEAYFGDQRMNFHMLFSIGTIERIFSFVLIMFMREKLIAQDKNNNIFINLFMIFFFICFYIAEANEITTRLSTLFIASYWILYPNILAVTKKTLNYQLLLLFIVALSIMRTSMYNSFLFRYDNILFGIESFETRRDLWERYSDGGVIITD